ncbi:hypothetical protein [Exiguobacterium sp. RIT594]|uniref:hypothetical protein n=1 Tax=Exiguobacterium sp. RIT594 TaxID=2282449 RepID=UPI000DF75322|nr:hypothetical protein [Exiguobacterium sp. RIT594]RDB33857.1 hypothetical protein DVG79_04030 [Exiguobacterium sp. RIT594]
MKKLLVVFMLVPVMLLSGCLFPDSQKPSNRVPYPEQIRTVQNAVDAYQKDTGVLPIKTREADTPLMERYQIELGRLIPRYMSDPPPNSFEGGGTFIYLLVDVEKKPTVKLMDLLVAEELQKLQVRIDTYRKKNDKYPFKGSIGKNQFTLDYKKLFIKEEPKVPSPYSDEKLSIYVDGQGQLFINYLPELEKAVETAKKTPKPGQDIRHLLYDEQPFVPAYSQSYTINKKGEPVFSEESIEESEN